MTLDLLNEKEKWKEEERKDDKFPPKLICCFVCGLDVQGLMVSCASCLSCIILFWLAGVGLVLFFHVGPSTVFLTRKKKTRKKNL